MTKEFAFNNTLNWFEFLLEVNKDFFKKFDIEYTTNAFKAVLTMVLDVVNPSEISVNLSPKKAIELKLGYNDLVVNFNSVAETFTKNVGLMLNITKCS